MALPSTGAMSFSAIASEYGLPLSNVSMGQCAGLNGALPSSSTAQVSASSFRSARYGPDSITLTRQTFVFGGNLSGYTSSGIGAVTSRSIHEIANKLQQMTCGNGLTVVKTGTAVSGWWKIKVNGSDKGGGTWSSADGWYQWNTLFWSATATGNVTIQYLYNN